MMGRIYLLVADASEEAAAAARWLGQACRADPGARVIALHVFEPTGHYSEVFRPGEWTEPVDVARENRARAAFDNVLPALGLGQDQIRTVARVGPAVEETVTAARATKADAIVLGESGAPSWRHAFRPTLAERLRREAHCPVVTVSVASAA